MDKVVLLEMQLKEALDREQNLKMLNDQLMNAMGGIARQDKGKDVQLLTQMHEQELLKVKTQLTERITILEYELRNRSSELLQLRADYNQLQVDYDELSNSSQCAKCQTLKAEFSTLTKQFETQKELWARESQEALTNQKAVLEYDLSLLRVKVKQLNYDLENEKKDKEKLHRTLNELNAQHEATQRSLLGQINDLHKAHNETILHNNHFQLCFQQREQNHVSRECQLEQEKIILEKHLTEAKDQISKLEQLNKSQMIALIEKETKFNEQKQELLKRLNVEKKQAEQFQQVAAKLKDDYQRKQSLLIEDCLKKDQQVKVMQTQLNRQKSKNKFYENALTNQQQPENKHEQTPKVLKYHKKNTLSNEFSSSKQHLGHTKNTLSQGHISKIKLFPSSIQKSEADSIHFNLTDMLNSTRHPADQNLSSCRQLNEENIVEQFNIRNQDTKSSQMSIPLPDKMKSDSQQILTDRQQSPPGTRIYNLKVPIPQRIKSNHTEQQKENHHSHPQVHIRSK